MSSKARRALGPLVLVVWAALLVDGHAAAPAVDAGEGLRRPPGRRLREETPSVGVLALDQAPADWQLAPEQQAAPQAADAAGSRWNATAGALVHGWVRKAAALDPRLFAKSFHQDRVKGFNRWLKDSRWSHEAVRQRRQAQAETGLPPLPDAPPVIYPGCHVFVNHRYKFLYVRHPKTASTSLLRYFTQCDDAASQQGGAGATPTAACVVRLNEDLSAEVAARLFADYFVFTVVRNPFQRLLSSYKFLVAKMVGSEECRPVTEGALSWDAYCQDPISLGAVCHRRPACCAYPSGFFWHHSLEQAGCLVAPPQSAAAGADAAGTGTGWVVDYVARQEHLDADMAEVLAEIDRRRDPVLPALSGGQLSRENVAEPFAHCPGGRDAAGAAAEAEVDQWGKPYPAAAPAQQYCEPERYFAGPHERCLLTLQHFFSRDFELLYAAAGRGPAALAAAGA